MPRTISFTHTYPYSSTTATRRIRRPEVPVRFFNPRDRRQYLDLNMLVDSGADTTCLPLEVADSLGIGISVLPTKSTRGAGGRASAYRHDGMLILLADKIVRCPVLFMPDFPVFLLGRAIIFDEFVFAFEQATGNVHVRGPSPKTSLPLAGRKGQKL